MCREARPSVLLLLFLSESQQLFLLFSILLSVLPLSSPPLSLEIHFQDLHLIHRFIWFPPQFLIPRDHHLLRFKMPSSHL